MAVIITEQTVLSWGQVTPALLSCLSNVLVAVGPQGLLVHALEVEFLILHGDPCHADPLLEESSAQEQVVVVWVTLVQVVDIELSRRYPPLAIFVQSRRVPTIGSMWEQ